MLKPYYKSSGLLTKPVPGFQDRWDFEFTKNGYAQYPVIDRSRQLPYSGSQRTLHSVVAVSDLEFNPGYEPQVFFGRDPIMLVDRIARGNTWIEYPPGERELVAVRNKAYAKLVNAYRGDAAEMFTTFLELESTGKMLATAILRLSIGWEALRKGHFRKFLKHFGLKRKQKHRGLARNKASDAGSLWLEYWMGWAPTANDILMYAQNVAKFGTDMTKVHRVRAGSGVLPRYYNYYRNDSVWTSVSYVHSAKLTVLYRARVECVNPNLALANRLGLVNPITSAVQVMPWSWMVGWFVNIEQCLNQYSDQYGFLLTEKSSTTTVRFLHEQSGFLKTSGPFRRLWSVSHGYVVTRRVPDIPMPELQVRLPKQLSITRALTSLSLLAGAFAKAK